MFTAYPRQKDTQAAEWFVSFIVMTKNSLPTGHALAALSVYDAQTGKIQLVEKPGYYSVKMPLLGFAPFSQGVVIEEKDEWIDNRKGLMHLSWPINEQQKSKFTTLFEKDRTFTKQKQGEQPFPRFNVITYNCKTHALARLAEILDIELKQLHNTLYDIPKWTSPLHPLKIKEKEHAAIIEQTANKQTLFCHVPMVIMTDDMPMGEKKARYNAWSKFNQIYYGVKNIRDQLERKIDTLSDSNPDKIALKTLHQKFSNYKDKLRPHKSDLKSLTPEKVQSLSKDVEQLSQALNETQKTLKQKSLLDSIMDFFKRLLHALKPMAWLDNTLPVLSSQATLAHCQNHFHHIPKGRP